jgi:membrane-associated protein
MINAFWRPSAHDQRDVAGTLFAVDVIALADQLAINPLNAAELIAAFGVIGVLAIIFAETGLLVGFFFPGDSLLFLAGIAASPFANAIFEGVQLSIWALLIGAPACAIAGAQLGHHLGARYGRRLFQKQSSRVFKPEYVEKAEHYFAKFGPAKAVILARFIPIVRTFLNPVAGVLGMPARQFLAYNIVGGILWTDGILLVGYLVAERLTTLVPDGQIDRYLLPLVAVIILISATPIFIEIYRGWREKRRGARALEGTTEAGGAPASTDAGRHRL